jgi:hypothetical protein
MSTTNREQDAQLEAILAHPSYRLAHEDQELLADDDSRPIRLQLELLKPERYLRRHKIQSTVVVFGSARVPSPQQAQATLAEVQARACSNPDDDSLTAAIARASQQVRQSHYYEVARRFAEIVSLRFQAEGRRDFVVVTGGGLGMAFLGLNFFGLGLAAACAFWAAACLACAITADHTLSDISLQSAS